MMFYSLRSFSIQRRTVSDTMQNQLFTKNSDLFDKYTPPDWTTSKIPPKSIPKSRLNLSIRPTPIHKWHLPGTPSNFQLYIKRDDLNGSVLGGNKIRKIEFTLAKAISEGKNHVLTWGSIKSNHCRTTALVCAQLGLKCTLLQTSDGNPEDLVTEGNVLLSMMTEARCVVCPNDTDFATAKDMMGEIMKKIETEGDRPCMIGRGGTQPDAVFAYELVLKKCEILAKNRNGQIVT